jgi:Metallo-beta-lactamase superfamily
MKTNPKAVKAVAAQTIGGKTHAAVQYDVRDWSFIVMFDPETGLPARVRTRDPDPIQGDSNYDLVLADWRPVGGVKVAHSLTYKLNERDLVVTKYDQVTSNPALAASLFEIPIMARAIAVRAAMGNVPYQWMIRRGYWGNLLDIAPGVSVSQGTSGNSVVVEMEKYLVIFDAPYHERFSEWMIQASKKRYPGKPIKYLVQSHHHWDHASGARTYVAEGATIIVGKGSKEHYTRMFSAPGKELNDRLHRNPRKANIVEVSGKHVIKDGKREVHAYLIESTHANATLLSYVPDVKLGFIVDIWSTNTPLPAKPTAGHREVVAGVKKWGLTPEIFAHGHGVPSTPYAQLAKLVGD